MLRAVVAVANRDAGLQMVGLPAERRIADTVLEADPGHAERHCGHCPRTSPCTGRGPPPAARPHRRRRPRPATPRWSSAWNHLPPTCLRSTWRGSPSRKKRTMLSSTSLIWFTRAPPVPPPMCGVRITLSSESSGCRTGPAPRRRRRAPRRAMRRSAQRATSAASSTSPPLRGVDEVRLRSHQLQLPFADEPFASPECAAASAARSPTRRAGRRGPRQATPSRLLESRPGAALASCRGRSSRTRAPASRPRCRSRRSRRCRASCRTPRTGRGSFIHWKAITRSLVRRGLEAEVAVGALRRSAHAPRRAASTARGRGSSRARPRRCSRAAASRRPSPRPRGGVEVEAVLAPAVLLHEPDAGRGREHRRVDADSPCVTSASAPASRASRSPGIAVAGAAI